MSPEPNQNPEQVARDLIDAQLHQAGWLVQANIEGQITTIRSMYLDFQLNIRHSFLIIFLNKNDH